MRVAGAQRREEQNVLDKIITVLVVLARYYPILTYVSTLPSYL